MAMSPPQSFEVSPRARDMAVFFLRTGLGVYWLNAGLVRYLSFRLAGVFPGGFEVVFAEVQIGLGLALMLGIFTTPMTVAAGLMVLVQPLVQSFFLFNGGPGAFPMGMRPFGRGMGPGPLPFPTAMLEGGSTSGLLLVAAVLWFSPREHNPWSLDRLIFAPRNAPEPAPPTPAAPLPDVEPAPPPGQRVARFMSGREE